MEKPKSSETTGGAIGGSPPEVTPASVAAPVRAIPALTPVQVGQEAICCSCEQPFKVRPMPGDPDCTICPNCQSVFRIASLSVTRPLPTTSADLENPDFVLDTQGNPADVVSGHESHLLEMVLDDLDETPRGLGFEALPDGWRVSVPQFSSGRLLFSLLGLIGPSMALMGFSSAFSRLDSLDAFDLLFGVVALVVMVIAFWHLLSVLMGRTSLEVRGDQALLREGLWPRQQQQTFAWSDVQQVREVNATVREESTDSEGRNSSVNVRHSFLQLLGPNLKVTLARNVAGGNFLELRNFLRAQLGSRRKAS